VPEVHNTSNNQCMLRDLCRKYRNEADFFYCVDSLKYTLLWQLCVPQPVSILIATYTRGSLLPYWTLMHHDVVVSYYLLNLLVFVQSDLDPRPRKYRRRLCLQLLPVDFQKLNGKKARTSSDRVSQRSITSRPPTSVALHPVLSG